MSSVFGTENRVQTREPLPPARATIVDRWECRFYVSKRDFVKFGPHPKAGFLHIFLCQLWWWIDMWLIIYNEVLDVCKLMSKVIFGELFVFSVCCLLLYTVCWFKIWPTCVNMYVCTRQRFWWAHVQGRTSNMVWREKWIMSHTLKRKQNPTAQLIDRCGTDLADVWWRRDRDEKWMWDTWWCYWFDLLRDEDEDVCTVQYSRRRPLRDMFGELWGEEKWRDRSRGSWAETLLELFLSFKI